MEVPRISGVDYSAKRLAAALCTKIPPNFETPTQFSSSFHFFLDSLWGRVILTDGLLLST